MGRAIWQRAHTRGRARWLGALAIGVSLIGQLLGAAGAAAAEAQTISFSMSEEGLVGGSEPLSATASSGLPVEYAVTGNAICAIDGSNLDLLEPGTCEVTATQAGDADWLPADPVVATIRVKLPPFTTPDGATLGRYALNGPVRSMAIDPSTGISYVGGDFTQVGVRTGAIAVVEGPASGSDLLRSGSPDVVSNQLEVFADDATGYFMAGAIGSTNGDGIHRFGVTRMTAAGQVDSSWKQIDPCSSGLHPAWDIGDRMVAPAGMSGAEADYSTVGLVFIDKNTGATTFAGGGGPDCADGHRVWASIPTFGPLAACAGWNICSAHNDSITYDAARHLLVTDTFVNSRQASNSQFRTRHYLVAYDTAAGTRLWSRELENPTIPPDFPPQATWVGEEYTMIVLDGAILALGRFPFGDGMATASTMLLVDSTNGAVLERWGRDGEQDLDDPSVIVGAPTTCTPADDWTDSTFWSFVRIDASHALGYASPTDVGDDKEFSACAYSTAGTGEGRHLVAEELATFLAVPDPGHRFFLPEVLHANRYVVGPNGAFDLDTNTEVAGWNPAPSSSDASLVSMGSAIVLGGNISFIHGTAASHVAALDRDLEPIDTFVAELPDTENSSGGIQSIRAVALIDDRLVVSGDLKGEFGRGPVLALDAQTGALTWAYEQPELADGLALAPNPATGGFYLGLWRSYPGSLLLRFAPSGEGFALDGTFVHPIGDVDGDRYVHALELIGSRLYIGGEFGSVDGQPRQGLARLTNGVLDGWDPAMIDELDPAPGDILELQPYSFVELGSTVVVGGTFVRIDTGDSTSHALPSVVAYDATTGNRVRPVGSNQPWFPEPYGAGFDMVVTGGTLYVAFGSTGVAAFNTTSLDYLPTRSTRTQPGWGENMILALGTLPAEVPSALGPTAVTTQLVMGGNLEHWSNRTAGNVVETLPFDRVTVATSGTGKGTVSSTPTGLACSISCNRTFPLGSIVTLKATPVAGATFLGWSGSCTGAGNCVLTVNGPRSVTATFSDKSKPLVGGPTTNVRGGSQLFGTAVPLKVTWTSSDPGGSGIKRYELARSTNGGLTWSNVSTTLTTASASVSAPSTGSVRYRVRAIDKAGNVGAWVAGPTLRPALVQQSATAVRWSGSWTTFSDATYSGGSARRSSSAGAFATYTFTGRAIGFVTTTAASRGQARFYVNGSLMAIVDLRSSSEKDRYVAWQMRWSTTASRTIKVIVVGTAGRPRVDVDAFAVLR